MSRYILFMIFAVVAVVVILTNPSLSAGPFSVGMLVGAGFALFLHWVLNGFED